ncbi:MBL fold metallo-hydrolase [Natronorubrum sp. JWXQ-INN-674]|uniref:MBL fold metallo-hydrolase n=1 Tax=Natronorubrum halalkaliphilum TaxID=2691917 RepID=A0A6B0VHP4_9EURY|nr:MBL fold metallo-hydrolase [Natronorubrum halalkaliphilum]MXV61078.1 MBL fold metallo-hydrolase [Natronorubrum halalkaliphilum]
MDRISLGNDEFEGRNNAYVLADDESDALALVDTGIATDSVRGDLRDGLATRGYEFTDIDDIMLTHFHVDHAGLAGDIQAESGATVYVHEADAPLVEQDPDAVAAVEDRRRDVLEEWGVPEASREEVQALHEQFSHIEGAPADVTPIEDGTVLEVGGRTLETVHAPGHSAGLCCFEPIGGPETPPGDSAAAETGREAFVGDAVLPVYTPNVGGADLRVERPLERYLESLARLANRSYERVWPGHRDPIDEPTERITTIIEHHRERTETILDLLRDHGPADPWTVSARLFGDLEGIHIVHGPGEAFAHLDHLRHEGVVALEGGEYRLVDRAVDPETVIPDTT